MKRTSVFRTVAASIVAILISISAHGGNDQWLGGNGFFHDTARWLGQTIPGIDDSVTFHAGGDSYIVSLDQNATTQDLFVSDNVTLSAYSKPFTYAIAGGGASANVLGGSLTLDALNLAVGDLLSVQSGSLCVRYGSRVSADDLNLDVGTVLVDGGGPDGSSMLTLRGSASLMGNLGFQNGSRGNSIAGNVTLMVTVAPSGMANSTLSVLNGSSLSVGSIDASTPIVSDFGTRIVVDGAFSSLLQTADSTLLLGTANANRTELDVSNSGSFTTGTGTTTVNATGLINVTSGTFTANGDIDVNTAGGTGSSAMSGININVAGAGAFFTQSGATSLTIGHASAGMATVAVSGGTFTTGTGDLTIHGTGLININQGGRFNSNGNVSVNSTGDSGFPSSIVLADVGSSFVQSGATTLTVGCPSAGAASKANCPPIGSGTVTIQSGTSFATGTGTTTICTTGLIDVQANGTLDAHGDVMVDGGTLNLHGVFNLAQGRSLTARNRATIDRAGSSFDIGQDTTVNILSGATLSSSHAVSFVVGHTSPGSLVVDGIGSNVGSGGLTVGVGGGIGNALIRNGATALLSDINVATDGFSGTVGTLSIESGAQVTFMGKLDIADGGGGTPSGTTPSGTVTVSGSNSTLTQTRSNGSVTVGQSMGSSATLNVNSGASFTALGPVTINATGTVNVNGGAFNANCTSNPGVFVDGGKLTVGGTLNLASGGWVQVRNGGLIDFGSGGFTFPAGGANLTILNAGYGGGQLKAGALSLPYGSPSSLSVEGPGSSVIGGSLFVATGGGSPSVSFFNNTTASFTSINIAYPEINPPPAMVVINGAQVSLAGPLDMADSGGGPLSASLGIDGQLTQSGSSPITIGQWGVGSATLTVGSYGIFTATGATTINPTGTLDARNGTFNAYGGVLVDGGNLQVSSNGFTLGAGKTLIAQNGGTVSGNGWFMVDRGTTVSILSGAHLMNLGDLGVGSVTNGSLVVDGLGSSVGFPDRICTFGRLRRRPG